MSSLLRKLLLHAMKFLGLCLLNYILMSCYIEIGHDKEMCIRDRYAKGLKTRAPKKLSNKYIIERANKK